MGGDVEIVCVGGGPAGLYFAICAKLRNPEHNITVLERSPEGVSYGWGFGFWDDVLDCLYRNDPVSARQIEQAAGVWNGIEVHIGDQRTAYLGGYGLSEGRQCLLDILTERAREVGIDLRFGHAVSSRSELAHADLVVAADGINSELRAGAAEAFATTVETGRNKYLWLGTTKVFDTFRYIFERTAAGWIWLHCYYLDASRSTCIVECPPETWQGLGFDRMGPKQCLTALEQIFARHLNGHQLISQLPHYETVSWQNGKQVTNGVWYHENLVLIGDAAHTTHFSIGSGTRLALGDSVVLAEKLAEHGDVSLALKAYDAQRRPVLEQVQLQALNSMRWLERVPEHMCPDSVRFAYEVSKRLGNRDVRWRYYLHLATQFRVPRAMRGKLTTARRARRTQRRAKLGQLVAAPSAAK